MISLKKESFRPAEDKEIVEDWQSQKVKDQAAPIFKVREKLGEAVFPGIPREPKEAHLG